MNKFSRLVIVGSIFLVLSFSFLFLTFSKGANISFLSNGVNMILSPFSSILSKPTQFFSQEKDVLSDLISAYDENKELKASLAQLENQIAEMESLEKENESLRQNLALKESLPEKHFISGFVLVRTPTSWSDQIIINIGETELVTENMLVVANGGLVGTVTTVNSDSSVVKLLSNSDDFTKIPIRIATESGDVYGILAGYDTDSNSFIINQLNSTVDIPIGSNVVTSDLAGTTPSNIQIGQVSSVKTSSSNLNKELYVKPTASFSNLYSVMVVGY